MGFDQEPPSINRSQKEDREIEESRIGGIRGEEEKPRRKKGNDC
jgi:hypothetical protein